MCSAIEMPCTAVTSASVPVGSVSTPSLQPFDRLVRNAIVERVIGTLYRECLDHLVVLNERHLTSVLTEFVRYYNEDRPHRTLGLQTPELRPRPATGSIRSRPVLNGVHPVRRGIADLHRRAEVGRKATKRYLDALASIDQDTTLEAVLHRLGRPQYWHGRRVRALHPFAPDDRASVASPRANAIIERFIGTLRRECLDHLIILDEWHLRSVLTEFIGYYNLERPHRTLRLETPVQVLRAGEVPVRSRPVLGGLHHVYERAA